MVSPAAVPTNRKALRSWPTRNAPDYCPGASHWIPQCGARTSVPRYAHDDYRKTMAKPSEFTPPCDRSEPDLSAKDSFPRRVADPSRGR